jgi:hypothetical protein
MPTVNSRVNVTLSPSLHRLVSRLAEFQKVSKSQVLRELLEAAEPALQRAVTLMASASQASAQVKTGLAAALDLSMDTLEGNLERELAHIDQYGPDLVDLAEAGRKLLQGGDKGRKEVSASAAALTSSVPSGAKKRVTTPVALTGGLGRSAGVKKGVSRGSV